MLKKLFLLIFIIIISSCSTIDYDVNENDSIRWIYMNRISLDYTLLIRVYTKGPYELLIPFRDIAQNIHFKSDNEFQEFLIYSDSLLSNYETNDTLNYSDSLFPLGEIESAKIIDLPEDFTTPERFKLIYPKLFRSGKISVYNADNYKFLEKIRIRESSFFGGSLAAAHDFWVYIGDFLFYEYHIIS